MTVCVTGAGGFIGRYVVDRFANENVHVVALARTNPGEIDRQENVDWIKWDLFDGSDKLVESRQIDCVIHLAGIAHRDKGITSRDLTDEYMRINCTAAVNTARDAVRAGVKRFVFVSSISVFGEGYQAGKIPLDESVVPVPSGPYGQSKLEAELQLSALSYETGIEVTVVRPALVVGPSAPGNLLRFAKLISRGIPVPVPIRPNARSFLGLENLFQLLSICSQHPKAAGEVFVAADPERVSTKDVVQLIALGMGRRPATVPVPNSIMRMAAKAIGQVDVYNKLFGDLLVDGSKAESILGWRQKRALREHFADLGREYVRCGKRPLHPGD